jgi:hypothetical protein
MIDFIGKAGEERKAAKKQAAPKVEAAEVVEAKEEAKTDLVLCGHIDRP